MIRTVLPLVLGTCLLVTACNAGPEQQTADATAHVGSADFQAKVLEAEQPVVVDFHADWCGPCKMMAPHLATVGAAYRETVQTFKLDVDAAGDIAERYGIRSIPTLIVFKDGEVVQQVVGYQDEAKLRALYAAATK